MLTNTAVFSFSHETANHKNMYFFVLLPRWLSFYFSMMFYSFCCCYVDYFAAVFLVFICVFLFFAFFFCIFIFSSIIMVFAFGLVVRRTHTLLFAAANSSLDIALSISLETLECYFGILCCLFAYLADNWLIYYG